MQASAQPGSYRNVCLCVCVCVFIGLSAARFVEELEALPHVHRIQTSVVSL